VFNAASGKRGHAFVGAVTALRFLTYEVLDIVIPVGAVVLIAIFAHAVQRFMIKAPTLAETKGEQRRRALETIGALNWRLPPDYKFDRDEANER
jgi:hypothetical protein